MKKLLIVLAVIIFILTACSDNSTTEVEPTEVELTEVENENLIIYFGELGNLTEIPTYTDYLVSHANTFKTDFTGTDYSDKGDSRRFFFTQEVQVMAEYEDDGKLYRRALELDKIQDDLYRVNPYFGMWSDNENFSPEHKYVTFYVYTAEETYFMT